MGRFSVGALLTKVLETRIDRDGQASALETIATAEDRDATATAADVKPERLFAPPQDILERALAQKVMNGWLQNQHQILVPLTFRLGRLDPADLELLMQFAAAALLNGSHGDDDAQQSVERWLRDVGAGEAGVAQFRHGQAFPKPLSDLIKAIRARNLEPYAYAAAVVASDTREAAGHLFANYAAARFALPADAVRSIDRRFRR